MSPISSDFFGTVNVALTDVVCLTGSTVAENPNAGTVFAWFVVAVLPKANVFVGSIADTTGDVTCVFGAWNVNVTLGVDVGVESFEIMLVEVIGETVTVTAGVTDDEAGSTVNGLDTGWDDATAVVSDATLGASGKENPPFLSSITGTVVVDGNEA